MIKTQYRPRKVTIEFRDDNLKPSFKFDGMWSGHDVGTVVRLFKREYLLHVRTLRREEAINEQPTDKQEVTK